jgi:putative ABC transport system substrate-binding protein
MAIDKANVDILFSSDQDSFAQTAKGFKNDLRGKTALQTNEMSLSKMAPEAAIAKISADSPSLVLAVGPQAAKLVRDGIKNIPAVYCCIFDPAEYSSPNMSGATLDIPADLKVSEIKRILPNIKKIAIVYSDKTHAAFNEFSASCAKQRFELLGGKASSEADLADAFKSVTGAPDSCFVIIPDNIYTGQSVKFVLLEGLKNKFPVVGLSPFFTKAGALISFECDYEDHGKQAGEIAISILNGANPQEIKPVRPKKIRYTLNMMVAEKLGLTIPDSVVNEASEVFK